MKNLKLMLFSLTVVLFVSCDNDSDPSNNVCDSTYVTNAITAAFSAANNYDDVETMDLDTHEYSMRINANGEICSIGYQNPAVFAGSYTMEVINETQNLSYTGTHSFSQANLDYQTITTPVPVNSGDIIRVRRTIIQATVNVSETIGRILRKSDFSPVPFPVVQGNVEFLNSNFVGNGGPVADFGMPYIPVGFKVN